jgi:hypothetical protein
MPCYYPQLAWRTDDGRVVFAERGQIHSQLQLACGQCIGCRLERSRQWAVRCMHEAQLHQHNCTITLTYNDEHLPEKFWQGYTDVKTNEKIYSGTLRKEDVQRFWKRLRKRLPLETTAEAKLDCHPVEKAKIRYYMGGEYGDRYQRPHYHAAIFGLDFHDKRYHATTTAGSKIYTSPTLEELWPLGYSSIGQLNFESAAYIARYIMKKITGDRAKNHYTKIDIDTGEIKQLTPEYNDMSRRPGIGLKWIQKYTADVYPHGKVIVRGKKANPPRYYDKQYEKLTEGGDYLNNNDPFEDLKHNREIEGLHHIADQTPQRLRVKETVAAAQIKMLKRKL